MVLKGFFCGLWSQSIYGELDHCLWSSVWGFRSPYDESIFWNVQDGVVARFRWVREIGSQFLTGSGSFSSGMNVNQGAKKAVESPWEDLAKVSMSVWCSISPLQQPSSTSVCLHADGTTTLFSNEFSIRAQSKSRGRVNNLQHAVRVTHLTKYCVAKIERGKKKRQMCQNWEKYYLSDLLKSDLVHSEGGSETHLGA